MTQSRSADTLPWIPRFSYPRSGREVSRFFFWSDDTSSSLLSMRDTPTYGTPYSVTVNSSVTSSGLSSRVVPSVTDNHTVVSPLPTHVVSGSTQWLVSTRQISTQSMSSFSLWQLLHFVYYESRKWKLKTRPTYEFRCHERLKTHSVLPSSGVVHYETIKWELKKKPISECRYDERLKTKSEESTRLRHWVVRGTGTPKDKDEVVYYHDSHTLGWSGNWNT
jgi:hypothetical protein